MTRTRTNDTPNLRPSAAASPEMERAPQRVGQQQATGKFSPGRRTCNMRPHATRLPASRTRATSLVRVFLLSCSLGNHLGISVARAGPRARSITPTRLPPLSISARRQPCRPLRVVCHTGLLVVITRSQSPFHAERNVGISSGNRSIMCSTPSSFLAPPLHFSSFYPAQTHTRYLQPTSDKPHTTHLKLAHRGTYVSLDSFAPQSPQSSLTTDPAHS